MEKVLVKKLEELNINETALLLNEDINLSVDYLTRKRIEKSVIKKSGVCKENNNILIQKMNDILGGVYMKKKIAIALSAGMIFSLAGGTYAYAKTPVAYVSMDINPSVELAVNAFDTVLAVEAYNEDGKNILEGTELVNTEIDDAVSTVVSNAISEGYIKEDGSSAIEITTSTDKEEVAVELDEALKETVDKTLNDNNKEATVETENVALARRDEARKLGITPGKLNLIQKLQALDTSITVEEYKDSSVKDIQKKFKELKKDTKNEEKAANNEKAHTDNNTNSDVDAVREDENTSSNNTDSSKEEINISKNNKEENIKNEKAEEAVNKQENKNNENNLKQEKSNNLNSQNANKEKNKNN